MRKSIGGIVSVAAFLLGAVVLLADAPVISIDPIGLLSYASFPQVYNVTGTVTHAPPPPGSSVTSVKDLTLKINGVQEGVVITSPFSGNTDPSAQFSLPWNIAGPGTYTVQVSARHGNDTGMDEEIVLVESTVVVSQCPAAPSVAAHYLQTLGIKSGSKIYKNIVSLVAQHMGPTTDFDGVHACDSVAYETAVKAFVDTHMSVPK